MLGLFLLRREQLWRKLELLLLGFVGLLRVWVCADLRQAALRAPGCAVSLAWVACGM